MSSIDCFIRTWSTIKLFKEFILTFYVLDIGYVCARPSDKNGLWIIGPFFADSYEVAQLILQSIQNVLPDKQTYQINVPSCNSYAIKLAEGLEFVGQCSRMYTRKMPEKPDISKVYAPTSLQLG